MHLQTQVEDKDIQLSYDNTLAAIGWTKGDGQYTKGDELLRLEKMNVGGKLLWRLTIIPKSAISFRFAENKQISLTSLLNSAYKAGLKQISSGRIILWQIINPQKNGSAATRIALKSTKTGSVASALS